MPRGKAKSNPDSAPSEHEHENGSKTPSKMAAVRLALGTLGYDAKPPALDDHIRKTWGLEIPHNMISSYKSQLKGKLKKGPKGARRGRPPAGESSASRDVGGNVSLKDLQDVKSLAGRLGIGKLRKLVEVLS